MRSRGPSRSRRAAVARQPALIAPPLGQEIAGVAAVQAGADDGASASRSGSVSADDRDAGSCSYALRPVMCSSQLGSHFPLLSRAALQHIIAARARRRLAGPMADMRRPRPPANHRGDRITRCETPRITRPRLRRPPGATMRTWLPSVAISDERV